MSRKSPRPRHSDHQGNPLDFQKLEPRLLLAGDVQVSFRGGHLAIWGDAQDNQIQIVSTPAGQTTVSGAGTTINRSAVPFVFFGAVRRATIHLGGGNDSISINGLQVEKRLALTGGAGADQIQLQGVSAGECRIDLGSGDDALSVDGLQVAKSARMVGANGSNLIALQQVSVGRDLQVRSGRGDDQLAMEQVSVRRQLQVDLGAGDDSGLLSGRTQVAGRTRIHMGSGQDFLAIVPERNGEQAEFASRLQVDLGPGRDQVSIDNRVWMAPGSTLRGGAGTNLAQLAPAGYSPPIKTKQVSDGAIAPINAQIRQVYAALESRGVDPVPFGDVRLKMDAATQYVSVADRSPTISVQWSNVAQRAVIAVSPGPTIASRAYGMVHTAMYDAWSAYDLRARSTLLNDDLQRPLSENTDANKARAMSFAAYRVLVDLFPTQTSIFNDLMNRLGYQPGNLTTDVNSPAGIGNRMAAAVLQFRHADGANQLGDDPAGTAGVRYSDTSGYAPTNSPSNIVDIEKWTPERVPIDAIPGQELRVQNYLTPHWGEVTPFALTSGSAHRPAPPQPFLRVSGQVDLAAGTITLADQTVVAIDRSLIGTVINPEFIAQAEEVVRMSRELTDRQKLVAEFWEDGGGTSFPPGTWMTFGQYVSARDNHTIDQDAQLFFALGNAVMDAGIATWEAKSHFDYTRPVRAIRELGRLGLIGQWDAGLGGYAIESWVPGAGVQRILATQFQTYQTIGQDPSPPFAEYTSGHSAFSAAAAAVLRAFTASDSFGASITVQPGESRFEPGTTPGAAVQLAWPTFTVAAEEAGMSRLYGGIHFMEGNVRGTALGTAVGQSVWTRVTQLVRGLA